MKFDVFHPVVPFIYFVGLVCIALFALQPVFLVLTFAASLAYSILLRGWRPALRTLLWQAPLVLLIALANILFVSRGSTLLFQVGHYAFYAESFAYGFCMGLMLVDAMLVFSNLSHILSSDKVMALLGNVAPTINLMISMALRLVPQFVRQGNQIRSVQDACTAANASENPNDQDNSKRTQRSRLIKDNARIVSVLMGWSLEDSLETADSMRARGWNARMKRTTYTRYRFARFDAYAVGVLIAMLALCVYTAWMVCAHFQFYPTMTGFASWWMYVPYILYVMIPFGLELYERVRWAN